MSKSFNSLSILPSNKVLIDKKIDVIAADIFDDLDLSVIDISPLTCSAKLLPILAIDLDVDIDGLEEQKQRELLQNAREIHKYGGTPYILKKAIKILHEDINVKEWFLYSGEPYHFRVEVNNSSKIIDQQFYEELEKSINKYKNVRSILENIEIKTKSHLDNRYASAYLQGESIKVYPYQPRELKAYLKNICASSVKQREKLSIYLDGESI